MTRFLAGAFSVVLAWVAYEVFRNPHGHRGGVSWADCVEDESSVVPLGGNGK